MSDDMSIIEFSQDITDAEQPDPLPEGDYPVEVIGAEMRLSKSSGNNMLVLQTRVSPDDFPADYPLENAPDGVMLTSYHVVKDDVRTRFNFRRLCEAFGVPTSNQIDTTEFVGQTAIVSVVHEEFEGVTNAKPRNQYKAA